MISFGHPCINRNTNDLFDYLVLMKNNDPMFFSMLRIQERSWRISRLRSLMHSRRWSLERKRYLQSVVFIGMSCGNASMGKVSMRKMMMMNLSSLWNLLNLQRTVLLMNPLPKHLNHEIMEGLRVNEIICFICFLMNCSWSALP